MDVYVFQAALWCAECGDAIKARLLAERAGLVAEQGALLIEEERDGWPGGGPEGTPAAVRRARLDAIKVQLARMPEDGADERTYDSDDFPKGPYADGGGESDTVEHCDAGADCLNALTVRQHGKRIKVGAWLENPLTSHGVAYVKEALADGGGLRAVLNHWRRWYAEELSWQNR